MTVTDFPHLILSNPDARPAAYQLACAAQARGFLRRFFTGYYCKQGPLLRALKEVLPPPLWKPIWRELRRRQANGLGPQAVHCGYLFEMLHKFHETGATTGALKRSLHKSKTLLFDFQVARQLKKLDFHIFLFFNDVAASYSLPAAKALGKVTVLRSEIPHSLDWLDLIDEERRLAPRFTRGIADDALEAWFLKRRMYEFQQADFILANSPFVKQSLANRGIPREKIYVLPGGANLESFLRPQPRGSTQGDASFHLLFVGAVCQRKGVGYLLEAFRNLNLPESRLTLVGPLLDPHLLAGVNGNVIHVPPVPHHEIPHWFAQADVFAFPSLMEGSAYVTYEAMAAGLPVVTTLNAGSYVRHGADGFIVPLRDTEALEEAMEFLYWNKGLRHWMGANAKERARLFTWERYRENVTTVLSHIHTHGALPPPLPEYGDADN
jgi:glycosyltransferase involved in cell wall biosynthesis